MHADSSHFKLVFKNPWTSEFNVFWLLNWMEDILVSSFEKYRKNRKIQKITMNKKDIYIDYLIINYKNPVWI